MKIERERERRTDRLISTVNDVRRFHGDFSQVQLATQGERTDDIIYKQFDFRVVGVVERIGRVLADGRGKLTENGRVDADRGEERRARAVRQGEKRFRARERNHRRRGQTKGRIGAARLKHWPFFI